MILTGSEIKKRLGTDIIISHFDDKRLNPNSYNLRLGSKLKIYDTALLDAKIHNEVYEIEIPKNGYTLDPNELYLASTLEHTETYNLVPKIDGRSSIGRLGLSIHITAGFGDIGFKGKWTLEMYCIKPIRIYPFMEICQISYYLPFGEITNYNGRYQNQKEIQESKYYIGEQKNEN